MRLLIIGMPNSIHTARWINKFPLIGWDIYFFPVYIAEPLSFKKEVTIFGSKFIRPGKLNPKIRYVRWTSLFFILDSIIHKLFRSDARKFHKIALSWIISVIKPDIVHTLEMQRAGYLTLEIKKNYKKKFPLWLLSIWGSDIFLFSRLKAHQERIKSVLTSIDGFTCECQRDVGLGKSLGYKGKVFPGIPATAGFDLEKIQILRRITPVSSRKIILLKGRQSWTGRALSGIRALALCSDLLADYEISIYSASPEVEIAAELFSQDTKVRVKIIKHISHEKMLELFGQARIAIGLGISDGLPNSMTEAMVMGAFPIQSGTSCADEWIDSGRNGFIVPPEDPEEIAGAIIKALMDDELVDQAAIINSQIIRERLDANLISIKTIKMYEEILGNSY